MKFLTVSKADNICIIFVYCNLRNVIDTYWRRSKIRTLYVWNFCCRSQNADVDCSLRNLNEQRDNE